MSFQNTCTEIVHKIMDFMDIPELNITSTLCKNTKYDSEKFVKIYKNENTLKKLTEKYTCRNCHESSYQIEKQFCTDCYIHMCHNCFSVRNCMTEFISVSTTQNLYDCKLICHDFCMYRCFKCKFADDRHELFLIDRNELQNICVDCFAGLDKIEKNKYNSIIDTNDWNDLDYTD